MSQVGYGGNCGCSPKAKSTCSSATCIVRKLKSLDVDVWDDPGCDTDNVVRVYNKDDCVEHEGYMYWPLEDMTISMPPSPDWSQGKTICEALKPAEKCGGGFVDGPVVQCDQLEDLVKGTLNKCGGDPVDGDLVQCDQIGAGLWINPENGMVEAISSALPAGCQEFVAAVLGSFATDLSSDTPYDVTANNKYYDAHPRGVLTYSVADYPYLGVAGRDVCMLFNSNMGYALTDPRDDVDGGSKIQTGLEVVINGSQTRWIDGFYMNGDGNDHESGTSNCLCFQTDGNDIVIEAVRWIRTDTYELDGTTLADYSDTYTYVDVSEITGQFTAG